MFLLVSGVLAPVGAVYAHVEPLVADAG